MVASGRVAWNTDRKAPERSRVAQRTSSRHCWDRSLIQRFGACPPRPGVTSRSCADPVSTMEVAKWSLRRSPSLAKATSSRPREVTAPTRSMSPSSRASPQVSTASLTTCQLDPKSLATSATLLAWAPTWKVTQRPALEVRELRGGAMRSSHSVQVVTSQSASTQARRRFTQMVRMALSAKGRLTSATGSRSFTRALVPQPGQPKTW